jgi:NADH-quinone oxidoreductase subunit L
MIKLIALVPLLPLLGFLINGFFGKKLSKTLSSAIACLAVVAAFVVSFLIFLELKNAVEKSHVITLYQWFSAGALKIDFSFLVDPLSVIFLMIITGIGSLIHLYSAGYMHDDEGHNRFFAYLNLFIFFMLLLVLGSNYIIMFVGWEGVGLCSYLLIGFWFKNTEYNNAAKKAFIMNRIGDLGFLLGIILIFVQFGSINYLEVFNRTSGVSGTMITAIALLLFVGAMGKSAQIPLYTWLPDAMAGPTPVSALIHAATMVTAGIYMIVRSNVLFALSEDAMQIVAIVGALTAFFAATIGLLQNDIKKVLAYSTVSQLGYMFLALGVGAFSSSVFHVTTHAFFKALLFLCAGSVIHAMSGEQDIRNMGGLRKKLPITFFTMLIGTIAISGIPPFSGFFSKDEILAHVFEHNKILWVLATITSIMTAFYMFRMLFLTFWGDFRGTKEQAHHLHESPKTMTIPLMVLAVLSVLGGLIGIPEVFHAKHLLKEWLSPIIRNDAISTLSHNTEYMLMALAVALAAITIYFAYNKFVKKGDLPEAKDENLKGVQKLVYNKYYVDETYSTIIQKPLDGISKAFGFFIDNKVIDGIVNLFKDIIGLLSSVLRRAQAGYIEVYLFAMVISIIIILLVGIL